MQYPLSKTFIRNLSIKNLLMDIDKENVTVEIVRPLELVEALPPRGPIIEDYTDPNPESVSTEDVVRNNNSEEVSTETCSDVDQQKGKDQEGAISGQDNGTMQDINGQDNGIKQNVKDEEEKIVSREEGDAKHGAGQISFVMGSRFKDTLQNEIVCEEPSENTPQENGLDHEKNTQHMEVARR
ncbi:unnamed protein product [Brassica oleracea var. botrytis]